MTTDVQTPEPLHLDLRDGVSIAAVATPGPAKFTLILIHDLGADLDATLPLFHDLALSDARKVAVDLPGHGLSSGEGDPESCAAGLEEWLTALCGRGWAPFILVGFGRSARLAWQLASNAEVVGLCLVSPRLEDFVPAPLGRSLPMILFTSPAAGDTDRAALRAVAQGPWMSASMAATPDELLALDDRVRGQIASHVMGFALEVCATTPVPPRDPAEQPADDLGRILS